MKTLVDTKGSQVNVTYDSQNRIIKVVDANEEEINLTYNNSSIIVSSNYISTTLNYTNNLLTSINNKFGTVNINYNSQNIISKITDVNGLGYSFEYYNVSPYKIKKVTENGLNNAVGNSLTFEYGFCVTRVKDNNNLYNTYTFNARGNTIGVTNLGSEADLNNAYGKSSSYDTNSLYNTQVNKNVNKLLKETLPIKFTKNLFKKFISTTASFNGTGGNFGLGEYIFLNSTFVFNGEENKDYVFSAYFKNTGKITVTYCNEAVEIPENNEYTRYDFIINKGTNSNLNILISSSDNIYMSSCQLEEGNVMNYYNLLDNPSFEDGTSGWDISSQDFDGTKIPASVVSLAGGNKALKLQGGPTIESIVGKVLPISGKKGDIYNLSFWYKNEGTNYVGMFNTSAVVNFFYSDNYEGPGEPDMYELNSHATEWQFFSQEFVAFDDYNGIDLFVMFNQTINNLYITNISFTKDIESDEYSYDYETGNMTYFRKMGGSTSEFKYDKNNQLTQLFNPLGNSVKFEYDNVKTDRLLRGISPTGISNEIKYDESGNPIKTIINNVNPDNDVVSGKKYSIRLKGTEKYLDVNYSTKEIVLKEDNCLSDCFLAIKDGDYYKFGIADKYLTILNNNLLLTNSNQDDSLFKIEANSNASYLIIPKNNENKALCVSNNKIILDNIDKKNYNEQFYFEDIDTNMFIETKAEYSKDGKYLTKTIDSLNNVTSYDINSKNGLVNKLIDAEGNETLFTYNDKEQIVKVSSDKRQVSYERTNNLINKIVTCKDNYSITYDDFLREKEVKVNNNSLVKNEYSQVSSNIISKTFGNNNKIAYEYDNNNRLSKIIKNDREDKYYYDNVGNIRKIISNNEEHNYYYDLASRISKYINNNYIIDYDYNINNDIVSKNYLLNNEKLDVNYYYDKNCEVNKVTIDGINFEIKYDILGRPICRSIDNNNFLEYTYCSNGNKTSIILKSLKIFNNLYEYRYNKINNITDIILNNKLIQHYDYDNNMLITALDYQNNKKYIYSYDNNGNILKENIYVLDSNTLEKSNKCEYSSNLWRDLLTKYNDVTIEYDTIGNPIKIGNDTLIWKNGRELNQYSNSNHNINYKYNTDGIRIYKKVDNLEFNYYLENNDIIFEKRNDKIIKYLRGTGNELLGLIYDNKKYYYIKNIFNDIIGIMDSNLNILANYEYDSWGKLLSIKDANSNPITNTNHIAYINPFRYRCYYYDEETKLYYLNNRYYNPEWKRFINSDTFIRSENNIYNLFIYCQNNPINLLDSTGEGPLGAIAGGAMAGVGPAGWVALGIVGLLGAITLPKATATIVDAVSRIDIPRPSKDKNDKKNNKDEKIYTVYGLLDDKNVVQYVGRTKDIKGTKYRHEHNPFRKSLRLEKLKSNLTYEQSRAMEEYYIMYFCTLQKGNYQNNQIHGVNPNNSSKYIYYKEIASNYLGGDVEEIYVGDRCENYN